MLAATTAWRWRSRWRQLGRTDDPLSTARRLSPCRTRDSSTSSPGSRRTVTVDKLYLVGFMASGKTTVARALARRHGWRAEEIDELIEARERRVVAEIFAKSGEPYFRSVERDIVRLLLPMRHIVVATGGGTFVDPENRAAMIRDGLTIWLDVPFEAVLGRTPSDGRRPLAADRAHMGQLFAARQSAYALAHLRIDAGLAPSDEIAERILDHLNNLPRSRTFL